MDSDNRISLFAPPNGSINTTRHLGTVAESEWFLILARIISSLLLFILIFGMSATVDVRQLRTQVHNKFAILTGVATQFIIMPLLGYLSVLLLNGQGLTQPMAISLLIVTASPGGSYSNWWCSMFNADLALSVAMTAISTLIGVIMLPANLLLYVNAAFGLRESGGDEGGSVLDDIDWASLFISLAIVVIAIGLGLCASFKISSSRFNRLANRMGSLSGILLIVFSAVVSSLSGNKDAQVWGQPWSFYVGVTAPCLVGLCIATFFASIARLKKPEVISVGVECCYQNVGIATSAVVAMFDDPVERGQALCVPLFYGIMEAILLGIYCIIGWKLGWTKAPRDEKLCVVLMTTYEVDDDGNNNDFVGGHMNDEERQQEHASSAVGTEAVVSPDKLSLFRKKRQHTVREHTENAVASPPGRVSLSRSISEGLVASPPGRVSLSRSISEGLDSISQMDSITDLVPFPQTVEYARCRVNSEEETAITIDSCGDSSGSLACSSPGGTRTAISLAKGTF